MTQARSIPTKGGNHHYHYTLRRTRQPNESPEGSTTSLGRDVQSDSHRHDRGLLSTSLEHLRSLDTDEVAAEAQRHPKMNIFYDLFSFGSDTMLTSHPNPSHPIEEETLGTESLKYVEEHERGSREVFLEAGLWSGPNEPQSGSSSDTTFQEASMGGPTRAFYIHRNGSTTNLPTIASFHSLGGASHHALGTPHPESSSTRKGSLSIPGLIVSKTGGLSKAGVTRSALNERVSPGPPPNTPWCPSMAEKNIPLISLTGQRSFARRCVGREVPAPVAVTGPVLKTAIQGTTNTQKDEVRSQQDEDYSFISFASPARVLLDLSHVVGGKMNAGSVTRPIGTCPQRFKFSRWSGKGQVHGLPLTPQPKSGQTEADPAQGREDSAWTLLDAQVAKQVPHRKQPPPLLEPTTDAPAQGSPHPLPSLRHNLNRAAELLTDFANQGLVVPTPTLSAGAATTRLSEAGYSDTEDNQSKCALSSKADTPLSRFSVRVSLLFWQYCQ